MRSHRDAGRSVAAAYFHHSELIRNRVGAGAAIRFGKRQSKRTEFSHLLDRVERKGRVRVPLLCVRCDFALRELATEFLHVQLLGREIEIRLPSFPNYAAARL